MKLLRFVLGLIGATILHALLSHWIADFPAAVDLFLILAVLKSLSSSPGWSALGGSAAGLVRDALSGGLYGLHGFADTLTAWAAARLQQRLVIVKPLQIGLLLAIAAAFQLAILLGLQTLLVPRGDFPSPTTCLIRLISAGILGVLFFMLSARARDAAEQRREQRRRRLKIAI